MANMGIAAHSMSMNMILRNCMKFIQQSNRPQNARFLIVRIMNAVALQHDAVLSA